MHWIKLHKGREESVLRQHPWIFSRAIQSPVSDIADGDVVTVVDYTGRVLGKGHYQNSSLAVRMISFEDTHVDADFWLRKLQGAAAYREKLNLIRSRDTNTYRLIHGEGDHLPGLIIDIYGSVAVLQAHSIGMHKARHQIATSLIQLSDVGITGVYCKSKDALPGDYAGKVEDEWLEGKREEEIIVTENGVRFLIDIAGGQKTGFFLDQRENRAIVSRYCQHKSVINCFSYSGGFSMYALKAGAHKIVSIDTSASALALLERNLGLNEGSSLHLSVKENVLQYLAAESEDFDVVIIDPPAFAKSLNKRHNAVQAYKRLNMMAMARVKRGGMLFTFSCSQVVDRSLFHHTVVAAAIESGRTARIVHDLSQGPDHPVSIFHPEGHYLKGLALYLD